MSQQSRRFPSLTDAYNFVRSHYTMAESVVPQFRGSQSNLSQASLNRDMLDMLQLQPGMSIADLGSGCGITGNTFAWFGCKVVGFEYHAQSCEVAREYSGKTGLKVQKARTAEEVLNSNNAESDSSESPTAPLFLAGAVNDHLPKNGSANTQLLKFDRLHGGYMMNEDNALRYCKDHLKEGGIAVLNVGGGNWGDVVVFKKGGDGKISATNSGIGVIFQEDAKPWGGGFRSDISRRCETMNRRRVWGSREVT